jgi:membrane protein DedA with SNARE-associated domain
MAEGAGVPVPGETTLLAAGALAHFGELSLGWVMLAAMGGALAGDNLGFLVGRLGGRALAERHGARLGLTKERLAGFDGFFERYGPKAIVIARFVTGLRVVCAVLAGASGLKWRKFATYNAIGVITWSIVIGLAGYFLGESWALLERWIGRSGLIVLAVILAIAAAWIIRARRARGASFPS